MHVSRLAHREPKSQAFSEKHMSYKGRVQRVIYGSHMGVKQLKNNRLKTFVQHCNQWFNTWEYKKKKREYSMHHHRCTYPSNSVQRAGSETWFGEFAPCLSTFLKHKQTWTCVSDWERHKTFRTSTVSVGLTFKHQLLRTFFDKWPVRAEATQSDREY